jgi:uncharacterized protein
MTFKPVSPTLWYDFSNPTLPRAGDSSLLLKELIETRAFQRLKSIRFLGGIDYRLVQVPNGNKGYIRYTRFQHSLGVARLALLYCNDRTLSPADQRILSAAALLHDIGHAPLSHSLEPVFEEIFEIDHHRATSDIICGRVPLGRKVYRALRHHDVDIERLVAMIAGTESDFDCFFSGPINFDTIEGILRAHAFAKPNPNIPDPEIVTTAALNRANDQDRTIVDAFWSYKDWVYQHIINSRAGILADFACQLFMRRNLHEISASDYFASEPQIFRKLQGLRSLLTSRSFERDIASHIDGPIAYKVRRFFTKQEADFFAREDKRRYIQTKQDCTLSLTAKAHASNVKLNQDLFDDDSHRASKATFGHNT